MISERGLSGVFRCHCLRFALPLVIATFREGVKFFGVPRRSISAVA